VDELLYVFHRYVGLVNDLPPATAISRPTISTRVRSVGSGHEEDTETEELVDQFRMIAVDSRELFELGLKVPNENVSLDMTYDALANVWLLQYAPENDCGFEAMGTCYDEVIDAATAVIKSKIAFFTGNLEVCADSLDEEMQYFVMNRWDEDHQEV